MTKTISSLILIFIFCGLSVPDFYTQANRAKKDFRKKTIDELVTDFTSDSWLDRVVPAERELESRGAEVIPAIIKLFDSDRTVKLKNTADLIYPGATEFYGHGWILNYDVDSIPSRAGWLLEELTFQDFGFNEGVIDHDELLKTVIKGKSESFIRDLKDKLKKQDDKGKARTLAIQKVEAWWQTAGPSWKRFDAVSNGLKSNDVRLQLRIFQWLRNGETSCDALTVSSFNKVLLPVIKNLSKSDNKDIRDEIQYLLDDNSKEKWWLRRKLERDFPKTYMSMELK